MLTARSRQIAMWIPQVLAAAILAMAAIPKLLGAADPVVLFTLLGAEPAGRLAVGALEGLATVLLLVPRTARAGAALGAMLMAGAIGTHLFRIGVSYGGDPSLFILACVVLASCVATFVLRRHP